MWKYIKNTSNLYQVNENGEIKALPQTVRCKGGYRTTTERILKHVLTRTGYHAVGLHVNGDILRRYVHVLVAEAFIENDDPVHKTQVDHIDGNLDNNSVSNLRWCTPKQNNGFELHRHRLSKAKKGKRPYNWDSSKPIHQINTITGEVVGEYKSIKEASILTGINNTGISAAATHKRCTKNGYTWYTQTASGYYWKFI